MNYDINLKRNSRLAYFAGFLILLLIEILIATYIHDDFIRPYLGDFLAVFLLYCFLMMLFKISVNKGILLVFIFSYALEFFQMINIVKVLQYQPPEIVMICLGSSFSRWDLLAYSLGLFCCYLIELYRTTYSLPST